MIDLCCISPEDLALFATALSTELARGKTFDEILVLRNFASQVSQTLFTLASQRQFLERNCKCGERETTAQTTRTTQTTQTTR